ncbi:MAG: hypothetical protein ABIR37_03790 [Candidatus Saccharimonadales bacterium]
MVSLTRPLSALCLSVLVILSATAIASAAQSSSSNYQVNEVSFGSGGELHACSATYCAKQSAGELGVGASSSASYMAQAGFNTDRVPSLTFAVTIANNNLGTLTSGTTVTAEGNFSVKSYLTDGYVVINASDPPKNSTYTMNALASPTASNSAAEQFGINVVANTSPATFGANPVQVPSGAFSFGAAATGYDTPNLYKYVKGDTIAHSTKSSGQTDYTVSYIFNTTAATPGGVYTMNHVLVATSTF